MFHPYIIRNGFLNRKQWTFSFKKQCNFGAKILNFRVSEAGLIVLRAKKLLSSKFFPKKKKKFV